MNADLRAENLVTPSRPPIPARELSHAYAIIIAKTGFVDTKAKFVVHL